MAGNASAYLLLVRETAPETYAAMTPAELRGALDRWNGWVDDVAATGKLQDGRPLEDAARLVAGRRGERVLDGPFSEAKELVGGYFLLSDLTLDEATEIARRCPALPHGMTVEIREVADTCHLARALGWQTMRGPAAQRGSQ
jgi:hypothetical protein